MKRAVESLQESELLKTHPIAGVVPGWFFRVQETSNMAWQAEGRDKWGRLVSCRGTDDQTALKECAEQARVINAKLDQP